MAILLLLIFLIISFAGIAWGLMRKDRYYQFPTLFCATWFLYFGPQAIGAIINKDKYPDSLHADFGLELALLYCISCILMGLAGYRYGRLSNKKLFHFSGYSYNRLFIGGVILNVIGFWGAYKLAQLCGGFIAQFTKGGHYGLSWVGAPVKYSFFSQLFYPGFLLSFLSTLYRPKNLRWILVSLSLLYPLAVIIFLGRRSMAAITIISILFSVFFVRRWAPSRLVQVLLLIVALAGTLFADAYRTKSQYGLHIEELKQIDVRGIVSDVFNGEGYSEFDMIVYGCSAVNRSLSLNYGLDFYNSIVVSFVPRQVVGERLKKSLFINIGDNIQAHLKDYYDWSIPYGSNPTGPFDSFRQFWFFGCILYFILGFIYRSLWTAAFENRNVGAQLWFIITAVLIPQSVFGSFTGILPRFLYSFVFVGSILYFARIPIGTKKDNSKYLMSLNSYNSYQYNMDHI